MANCALCTTELKFMTTPNLGAGKLGDGGRVCRDCFSMIAQVDQGATFKLKGMTTADLKNFVNYPRLEEIKAQIQALNPDNFSAIKGKKEINDLPRVLSPDEKIDNLVQGKYNSSLGVGLLVSTNRRLIFLDRGAVSLKVEDFPLDKISSIQYETGLAFAKIIIHTSGNVAKIDHVPNAAAMKFAEFVRNKLSQPKEQAPQANFQTTPQPTALDQIEKLAKLKESGILTDEEFAVQKKKLLEMI